MSSGHRDDRPALLALGLVLLAICLIGLFETTARHYASQEVIKYQTSYPEDGNGGEYAPIVAGLREFDPREDTYAQWIMATFAILATFASVWAVLLLRDTLSATRDAVRAADDAVKVTRELGQTQVRAYVHALNPTVFNFAVGAAPYIMYRPKNYGQTPANNFRQITTWRIVPDPQTYKVRFGKTLRPNGIADMAAGEFFQQTTTLPVLTKDHYDLFIANRVYLLFVGVIRYRDVFGRQRRTIFRRYMDVRTLGDDDTVAMSNCAKNNRSS